MSEINIQIDYDKKTVEATKTSHFANVLIGGNATFKNDKGEIPIGKVVDAWTEEVRVTKSFDELKAIPEPHR